MATTRQTYTLRSTKHIETCTGTRDEAMARAIAIEDEYQPPFGVQIEDAAGVQIADVRDGVDVDAADDEAIASEIAGQERPL